MELLLVLAFTAVVNYIVYIVAWKAGWKAREQHAIEIMRLLKKAKEAGELIDPQNPKDEFIHITIESHSGVLYVYNKNDSSFMAQGSTREELEEALDSRFPGKRFAASKEDLQKVGFLR